MNEQLRWYDRENLPYQKDITIVKQYAAWFGAVPWQLFCTLTFARKVSDAQADKIFRDYIERLEQILKTPICYLRGDEKRFSGCGKPGCPRHYHAVLVGCKHISANLAEQQWKELAGKRDDGPSALILPYDPSKGKGIEYIMKMNDKLGGDYTFGRFETFLPTAERMASKQFRRRLRRHPELVNLLVIDK